MKTDDTYRYPADKKIALNHLEEFSVRSSQGKQFRCCDQRATVFKDFSIGVKLYFRFLLQMCILFGILTILVVPELVYNITGNYYDSASSSYLELTTIASQAGTTPGETDMSSINTSLKKQKIGKYVTIYTGIVTALAFMLIVGIFDIKNYQLSNSESKKTVVPSQFAVKVEGLPRTPKTPITEDELKHFFEMYGEVIECVFAKNFLGSMSIYQKLHDLKTEITKEKLKNKSKKITETPFLKKLLIKKELLKKKLQSKFKEMPNKFSELPNLHAYIMFNETASKEKLMNDYTRSVFVPKKLYFRGKYKLKISQPDNPSEIKWENLEVSCCSKLWRALFTIIFVFILLVLSIAACFAIQNSTSQMPTSSTCIKYDLSFSIGDLQSRIDAQSANKTEFKNCYCTTQSFISIVKDSSYALCKSYLYQLGKTWGIKIAGMIGVVVVNILLEILLELMAKFKRFSTATKEYVSLTTLLFISSFINMVIITLFVNANFGIYNAFKSVVQNKVGGFFFGGKFSDLDRNWFVQVGTSFIILGFINILVPQVIDVLVKKPLQLILRCCCANPSKLIQYELNSKYEGPPFLMYMRYAYTLGNIFMTMIFAPGVPVLLLLCFFQCGLLYWCDKYLFVSHYKRPSDFGTEINRRVFDILYWAAFFYIAFALWVYSCADVYPSTIGTVSMEVAGQMVNAFVGTNSGFFKRITSGSILVMFIVAVVVLGINVIKIFLGFLVYIFTCCVRRFIKPAENLCFKECTIVM